MTKTTTQCYKCRGTNDSPTEVLYGYTICNTCKSKLGLFQDRTLKKHIANFKAAKELDPNQPTFEEEIRYRLEIVQ